MSKAEIYFSEELSYISSKPIKDFVLKCFNELTPDYFWTFSAFSSHKHHPSISNGKYGIVLHTKLCVWWGRKLAESMDCMSKLDLIIASILLHDLQKFGTSLDENQKPTLAEYTSTHGPMLALQIEKLFGDKINEDIKEDIETIICGVALHMGKWTDSSISYRWRDWVKSEDLEVINIVHLADYIASKKVDAKLEELENMTFPGV